MAPATSPPTRTSAWVTRWMRAIMTGGIVWHLARLVRNIRGRFFTGGDTDAQARARARVCSARGTFDRRDRGGLRGRGVGAGRRRARRRQARQGHLLHLPRLPRDRGLQERLSDVQRAETRG